MLAQIDELQGKIASSKSELTKTSNLEKQARRIYETFRCSQSPKPGRSSHRLVPAADESILCQPGDRQRPQRVSSPASRSRNPILANWMRYNWLIELPQADFSTLGKAVADSRKQ